MTDTSLARCHICSAVVPDSPDDRRQHIDEHRHIAKQIDALARELRAAKNDLTSLRAEIDDMNARKLPDSGIRITDMPDDELDDDELDDDDIDTGIEFVADPNVPPGMVVAVAPADDDDEVELPTHPTSPYGI